MRKYFLWTIIFFTCCGTSRSAMWQENAVALKVDSTIYTGTGEELVQGAGTGIIVLKNGTAVTNAHVIRRAKRVTGKFEDGRWIDLSYLVSFDSVRDIAMLKAGGLDGVHEVDLVERSDVEKGESIVAIGNSLDWGLSVLHGHITNITKIEDEEFVVVDVQLAKGSSGGPIFDSKGRLVGLLKGIVNTQGGVMGLAVPAWELKKILYEKSGEPVGKKVSEFYSPEEMKRRLKTDLDRKLCLEPLEGARLAFGINEGRDYSFLFEVTKGELVFLIGDQSRTVRAGDIGTSLFTAIEPTVLEGAVINNSDHKGCFRIQFGHVEW